MSEPGNLIGEDEAAKILDVTRTTLVRWRKNGTSPPYYKYPSGGIKYNQQEVIDWIKDKYVEQGDKQ